MSHIMEHEFFCLGHLGSQGSMEKSGFEVFWVTFEGGFFNFFWAKKNLKYFLKYFSVRIEKLHKMAFIIFFFLKKFEKVEKNRLQTYSEISL